VRSTLLRSLVFAIGISMPGATAFAQDGPSTKALHDLFAREWEYGLQQNPTRASQLGDRRWNDRWRDVSVEAFKRRHAHAGEVVAELTKIDRARLSAGIAHTRGTTRRALGTFTVRRATVSATSNGTVVAAPSESSAGVLISSTSMLQRRRNSVT